MERTAGFILAGGRSRRMGTDKALLPFGGQRLIVHIAQEVQAAASSVALIAQPGSYGSLGIRLIADEFPDWGPLGGIVTALRQGADFNLITACDMPGLNRICLLGLLDHARKLKSQATVAITEDGRQHPLCAVYTSRALLALEDAVASGLHRVHDALDLLDVDEYPMPNSACINVNTPEEWATIRS